MLSVIKVFTISGDKDGFSCGYLYQITCFEMRAFRTECQRCRQVYNAIDGVMDYTLSDDMENNEVPMSGWGLNEAKGEWVGFDVPDEPENE